MMKSPLAPRKLLAKAVAAIAIAVFWSISAVGTTVGTAVGVTTLATAVTAATSTSAEAGYRRRRHRRSPVVPRATALVVVGDRAINRLRIKRADPLRSARFSSG